MQRPTRPRRIPSVLTKTEVAALLGALDGEMAWLAKLLYGTGMRLMEGLRLRVKDMDFDREVGVEGVEVPDALAVKYPDLGRRPLWSVLIGSAYLPKWRHAIKSN